MGVGSSTVSPACRRVYGLGPLSGLSFRLRGSQTLNSLQTRIAILLYPHNNLIDSKETGERHKLKKKISASGSCSRDRFRGAGV